MTKQERRPITPELLHKIKGVWDPRAHERCDDVMGSMLLGLLRINADWRVDCAVRGGI